MSNISQAQKNIKKKLSFDDYQQPLNAIQQKLSDKQATPVEVSPIVVSDPVVTVPDALTYDDVDESEIFTTQTCQKIKETYYLSEQDHAALNELYARRLQRNKKTDRSTIVSEAIRLLYKRETFE